MFKEAQDNDLIKIKMQIKIKTLGVVWR